MRRRPGFIGFVSVTAPAVLNAAVTAVLGVLTARYLGPTGQGDLTTIMSVGAILSLVLTLGTGMGLRLRARPTPRPSDVSAFLGASLIMVLVGALLAPAICFVFELSGIGFVELVLTAIVAGLLVAARQSSDLLQAYGRAGRSLLFLALGALFQCLLFGLAVVASQATLRVALVCAAAGIAVQTALGLWDLTDRDLPRPNLAWSVARSLVRLGVPSVAYTVALVVSQRLGRLVTVGVLGSAAGGIYAAAATMAEASRITSSAVGQLLFVQTAATGRITTAARRTYCHALVVQTAVVVAGWLIVPYVVPLLFGDAYLAAVPLAQVLLVAEMFMGAALMDARLLMGVHRVALVAWITAALVVLAVPAYVILVRAGALLGVAAASLMLYLIYAAVLYVVRLRAERNLPTIPVRV